MQHKSRTYVDNAFGEQGVYCSIVVGDMWAEACGLCEPAVDMGSDTPDLLQVYISMTTTCIESFVGMLFARWLHTSLHNL